MAFMVGVKKPAPTAPTISSDEQARIDALGSYTGKSVGLKGNIAPKAGSVQAALELLLQAQNPTPAPTGRSAFGGIKKTPVSVAEAAKALDTAIATAETTKAAKDAELAWIDSVGGMHHQGRWKHLGRQIEKQTAKVVVPVTAITAAALATIPVFGTIASVAVTQAGGGIARVAGAGAAREEGLSGHAAKDAGRQLAKKTRVWGARGGSLGSAANAVGTSGGSSQSIAGAVNTGANVGISISHDGPQQQTNPISISIGTGGAPGAGGSGAGQAQAKPEKDNSALIALGAFGLLAYAAAA